MDMTERVGVLATKEMSWVGGLVGEGIFGGVPLIILSGGKCKRGDCGLVAHFFFLFFFVSPRSWERRHLFWAGSEIVSFIIVSEVVITGSHGRLSRMRCRSSSSEAPTPLRPRTLPL